MWHYALKKNVLLYVCVCVCVYAGVFALQLSIEINYQGWFLYYLMQLSFLVARSLPFMLLLLLLLFIAFDAATAFLQIHFITIAEATGSNKAMKTPASQVISSPVKVSKLCEQ